MAVETINADLLSLSTIRTPYLHIDAEDTAAMNITGRSHGEREHIASTLVQLETVAKRLNEITETVLPKNMTWGFDAKAGMTLGSVDDGKFEKQSGHYLSVKQYMAITEAIRVHPANRYLFKGHNPPISEKSADGKYTIAYDPAQFIVNFMLEEKPALQTQANDNDVNPLVQGNTLVADTGVASRIRLVAQTYAKSILGPAVKGVAAVRSLTRRAGHPAPEQNAG